MATKNVRPAPVGTPVVSAQTAASEIARRIAAGEELQKEAGLSHDDHEAWELATKNVLERAFGQNHDNVWKVLGVGRGGFVSLGEGAAYWQERRRKNLQTQLSLLRALLGVLELEVPLAKETGTPAVAPPSKAVFIVHGHDQRRHEVEVLLRKLDLQVTILADQPSKGKTVVEKLEEYSNCAFAVVLVTGDDEGRLAATASAPLRPRARQNVILELGYFMGKIGRDRVCALYEPGVEIPSDYAGVVFVELDPAGAWHFKLGKELKAAGLAVDMNKL